MAFPELLRYQRGPSSRDIHIDREVTEMRQQVVKATFHDDERVLVEEAARVTGISPSTFLRVAAIKEARRLAAEPAKSQAGGGDER